MGICMLELDSVWKFMECDVGMDGGGYIRLRALSCAPVRWVFRRDGAPNNAQQQQSVPTRKLLMVANQPESARAEWEREDDPSSWDVVWLPGVVGDVCPKSSKKTRVG